MTPSASPRPGTDRKPQPARRTVAAAVADSLAILLFAAVGRDAHQRGDIVTGVFATAWPFLAGAAAAWLALRLWREPLRLWPAGVAVWLGAVTVGMALRGLTGQTVVLPFVVVAMVSLAVLLLGYRLLAGAGDRFRARRTEP